MLPRITQISGKLAVEQNPTVYFSGLAERLEKEPSRDCPPGNNPDQLEQTYDGMLLSLLSKVSAEAKEKVKEDGVSEGEKNEKIGALLMEKMQTHVKQLGETIEKDKKELESEIKEQKKHITSEDLHDGFESKVCGVIVVWRLLTLGSTFLPNQHHRQSLQPRRLRFLILRPQ